MVIIKDQKVINVMSLFLLLNAILNFEKTSFLPRSNSWYPYFVKTEIGMTGSEIVPNCVRFLPRGKLTCINADGFLGRHEPKNHFFPVDMFLSKFFYQLRVSFCAGNNMAVFSSYVFSGMGSLNFCIGNSFHNIHLGNEYIVTDSRSQVELEGDRINEI
jgi:hypothetical protein